MLSFSNPLSSLCLIRKPIYIGPMASANEFRYLRIPNIHWKPPYSRSTITREVVNAATEMGKKMEAFMSYHTKLLLVVAVFGSLQKFRAETKQTKNNEKNTATSMMSFAHGKFSSIVATNSTSSPFMSVLSVVYKTNDIMYHTFKK